MANQNNGALNYNVRFGNGQNYDSFESSSSNKETKSFWQKWKGIIIGGAGLLCVSILGVIGYNKGWFKKAGDKIKEITGKTSSKAASNAQENVQSLDAHLKTLDISSQSFNGRTISDMITNGNVKKAELQAVTKELSKKTKTKENQAAIIFILNQLRKHLSDEIQDFKKDEEISEDNVDKVLETILSEEEPKVEEPKVEKPEINNREKTEESNSSEAPVEPTPISRTSKTSGGGRTSDPSAKQNPPTKPVITPKSPVKPVKQLSHSIVEQEITEQEITKKLKELEELATLQSSLALIQELKKAWNDFIDSDKKEEKSSKAGAVAGALGWAIQRRFINNDNDNGLVQGILSKFNNQEIITQENTSAVAYALDRAIRSGFINNDNDNGLVQGILSKFNKNGVITQDNTSDVASLLITAKAKGFVNDDTTYNDMINECINANARAVENALDIAIRSGVIKNENQDHKLLVQDIIKRLKSLTTDITYSDLEQLINLATDKGFINDDDIKKLQEE